MRAVPLALAALVLLAPAAFATPATDLAAIQGFQAAQQAQLAKAQDQLVANNSDKLLGDPATQEEGNPHGDFTVVEFFDYTCVYCKAVEPRLESFLKTDKHTRFVIKEFPILTPASMVATRVALAAARQGKYQAFHDTLMNYRGQLDDGVIMDTAKQAGVNMTRLQKDMNDPAITNEVIANFNLARALRIFQTPGFIIDGHVWTGQSADIDFPKLAAMARAKKT